MRNIQVIVEYDGTNYCGWQIQKNGISVQEKIIQSIEALTGEKVNLIGSGRTDAGVHALGQSANFLTECSIPVSNIPLAINGKLPKDIRIVKAVERNMGFHSRYDATGKVYQYRILNNKYGSALNWNRAYHVKETLDFEEMKKAAGHFCGSHDFTSFCSAHSVVKDKVRSINISQLERCGDEIIYTVEGTGFLYNMVRIIVGTLIEVGLGKISSEAIPEILNCRDRQAAGPTAPAKGLYLKEVLYQNV